MLIAEELGVFSPHKSQRRLLQSQREYCIFDIETAFKISERSIKCYEVLNNNLEIGVLLNNRNMIDKESNMALFDNKKALANARSKHLIMRLYQPDESNYVSWVSTIQEPILTIQPSIIMLPIDKNKNHYLLEDCNLTIQELNLMLFPLTIDNDVVLYQSNEPLSSLAFIIQSINIQDKVSLCLNLDYMISEKYSLKDLEKDIYKFNIINKISMIHTNQYSKKSGIFKEFVDNISPDVIVFGDNFT